MRGLGGTSAAKFDNSLGLARPKVDSEPEGFDGVKDQRSQARQETHSLGSGREIDKEGQIVSPCDLQGLRLNGKSVTEALMEKALTATSLFQTLKDDVRRGR